MTNFEQATLELEPVVEKTLDLKAEMEAQMSVSWDEIDSFIGSFEHVSGSSRNAWSQDWFEGKKKIFEAWGNKLRVEKDVVLGVNFRDVHSSVREMLINLDINSASKTALTYALSNCHDSEVVDNKLEEAKQWFGIKLGKGMKLSRALGRLVPDAKERDAFQTAFSMLLQSYKVSGKVVLSIDPIDILTMSYNPDSEWRSCHNIVDGEFRAGVLSYLVDSSTFIGYAYRRKAPSYYGGVEIPNKTWRQIGYFDSDLSMAALSTHYPSVNKNNRVTLTELLIETMGFELDEVGKGFIGADYIGEHMNNDGYHYNDITEGRESKSYCIDFTGASLKYEDHGDDILRKYRELEYKGEFFIGEEGVTGFDNNGTVYDSESITSYSSYEDYDEDDDW